MSGAGLLLVGGDGFVARALLARLRDRQGRSVLATTRRPDAAGPARPLLDLATGQGFQIADRPFAAAILCAARARLADCRAEPESTGQVNVAGTAALARRLAAAGTRVILLSTDKVYDGALPHRRAQEPPCPTSAYGRQKAAAEAAVLALPGAAVLRLSKVVGAGSAPFAGWLDSWAGGGTVEPFADFAVAPVPAGLVAEAVGRIVDRGVDGILQLTASRDIDYARAARHLAGRAGVPPDRVRPVTGRLAAALGGEPPSAFTSLDGTELHDRLGLRPPDPFQALDSVMRADPAWVPEEG